MNKRIVSSLSLILITTTLCIAWGPWGHTHINKAAIFALPEEMRVFFYDHADFLTEESVVPDIRKYTLNDKAEFPRHFINSEGYNTDIDKIPRSNKEAYQKYDSAFLQQNGILPWYIQDMMVKLTNAFKSGRKSEILFLAGDLGHYLGDANMPLHTSINHNGQLTNQVGIHALWESQLPEYFGNSYNLTVSDAVYIKDINTEVWRIIKHTHSLADTLLLAERNLKATFPKDKIYKTDSTGNVVKAKPGRTAYSYEYAQAYHKALHGMVEAQMREAIRDVANFWYTAWVNAGSPNMNDLDSEEVPKAHKEAYEKELKLWKKGKLAEIKLQNEF